MLLCGSALGRLTFLRCETKQSGLRPLWRLSQVQWAAYRLIEQCRSRRTVFPVNLQQDDEHNPLFIGLVGPPKAPRLPLYWIAFIAMI